MEIDLEKHFKYFPEHQNSIVHGQSPLLKVFWDSIVVLNILWGVFHPCNAPKNSVMELRIHVPTKTFCY